MQEKPKPQQDATIYIGPAVDNSIKLPPKEDAEHFLEFYNRLTQPVGAPKKEYTLDYYDNAPR